MSALTNGMAPLSPEAFFARCVTEVEMGLPCAKTALDCAQENQAFYDREGERYLPQREAESTFDFMGRPKRQSGIVHQAIELLTMNLYAPGPGRQFDDPDAEAFLNRVWADNLYDGLLQRADALSTLNDVCAIQVDAGEGDFAAKPITLQLWGREEFHVWTDPNCPTKPLAVVTIDRYDEQTRYRLWNDQEVRTFLTTKAGGTAGGRVAVQVAVEPNTYGCIPFGFIHYDLPVRQFFTRSPGTFLRKAEIRVDDRLSLIDEAIQKHLCPVPVAENVPLEWNPVLEPQRFIRLFSAGPQISSSGDFESGLAAKLYYLQASIDIAGAWADNTAYIEQALESCGIPPASIRMTQTSARSGIALIAEQAPLLMRARQRRAIFNSFEVKLTATILLCAGNHYGKSGLMTASKLNKLTLAWSEPDIPIPGADRDLNHANAISMGLMSRLMVIQERYGCTRARALEILKQIAEDRDDEESILGPPEPPPAPQVQDDGLEKPPPVAQGGQAPPNQNAAAQTNTANTDPTDASLAK